MIDNLLMLSYLSDVHLSISKTAHPLNEPLKPGRMDWTWRVNVLELNGAGVRNANASGAKVAEASSTAAAQVAS